MNNIFAVSSVVMREMYRRKDFYVLLILPQQRKQKKWQEMLSQLKTGDRVVTSGGVRGIIIALRDDYVHLRVAPDNLKIEVARSAIVSMSAEEKG